MVAPDWRIIARRSGRCSAWNCGSRSTWTAHLPPLPQTNLNISLFHRDPLMQMNKLSWNCSATKDYGNTRRDVIASRPLQRPSVPARNGSIEKMSRRASGLLQDGEIGMLGEANAKADAMNHVSTEHHPYNLFTYINTPCTIYNFPRKGASLCVVLQAFFISRAIRQRQSNLSSACAR